MINEVKLNFIKKKALVKIAFLQFLKAQSKFTAVFFKKKGHTLNCLAPKV